MKHLLLVGTVLLGLGACKKERVAECDAFLATAEKLASCEKLPADQRKQMEAPAAQMRQALKAIDDAGGIGSAPKDMVETLRSTCKSQDDSVKKMFESIAPECVK